MRPLFLIRSALVATLLLVAVPASAVTVDQIVALHRAGVSDAVILALLDRDLTVLTLEPEQLVTLKREGLSDTIITAMLRNGRAEAEDAARAVSDANAYAVLNALETYPRVVVLGHGPDRPNTTHTEDYYRGFRDGVRVPSAANVGPLYPLRSRTPYRKGFTDRAFALPAPVVAPVVPPVPERVRPNDRMLCLAQVNTAAGPGPSYVTECPAVMQRAVRTR